VYQARAAQRRLPDLLSQAARGIVAPSAVDARLMLEFDRAAFETAREFEAVDLSPVSPLGVNRVLGGVGQNNILSAIRNVEVLADSTTALALECARRRKDAARRGDPAPVRLAASARLLRLQPLDRPEYSTHFRVFALVTAGRDPSLEEHLRFYLRLFRTLDEQGFSFAEPLVEITDLGAGLPPPFEPLAREFPEASFRSDPGRTQGRGYYVGTCLRISPLAPDGQRYPIVDGGYTNWTARLLANRKERLLTSGVGTQLACLKYRR
jgi:hypothetical protein